MPFASITEPNLPLSQFKSQLREVGLSSTIKYYNLIFARRIGYKSYTGIASFKGVYNQISEWLFSNEVWKNDDEQEEKDFLNQSASELCLIPMLNDKADWLLRCRHEVIPAFIEECANDILKNNDATIVAFS